ncbi:T9SS type A sorting domain-containing protein, partial [bacterium]|nr:T9SS type A sorting domain-containing protein [bacterium]
NKTSSLKVEKINTALKSQSSNYSLFPNPAKDILNIAIGNQLKGGEYKVYSVQGTLIQSGSLIQENTQIDVSMLDRGLYVIKMRKGSNLIIDRFIIE